MGYRLNARLSRLEQTQQEQQAHPKLYVLWDDDKLPWHAPDNCLIVRLARTLPEEEWTKQAQQAQQLTPEETWAQWNRPVEREAPPRIERK